MSKMQQIYDSIFQLLIPDPVFPPTYFCPLSVFCLWTLDFFIFCYTFYSIAKDSTNFTFLVFNFILWPLGLV